MELKTGGASSSRIPAYILILTITLLQAAPARAGGIFDEEGPATKVAPPAPLPPASQPAGEEPSVPDYGPRTARLRKIAATPPYDPVSRKPLWLARCVRQVQFPNTARKRDRLNNLLADNHVALSLSHAQTSSLPASGGSHASS